jgi:hypothetical protein
MRYELRTHEERIRKAQGRRKAQQGDYEQESFLERKWVNTNKNHSGYDHYEQRPCQAKAGLRSLDGGNSKLATGGYAIRVASETSFLTDEEGGAARR